MQNFIVFASLPQSCHASALSMYAQAVTRAQYPNNNNSTLPFAGTQPEQHVLPYFVEERAPGLPGYADWLAQLHKAVLSKA